MAHSMGQQDSSSEKHIVSCALGFQEAFTSARSLQRNGRVSSPETERHSVQAHDGRPSAVMQ